MFWALTNSTNSKIEDLEVYTRETSMDVGDYTYNYLELHIKSDSENTRITLVLSPEQLEQIKNAGPK
jgi:hypothetical protein